jgi:hypothetical protein
MLMSKKIQCDCLIFISQLEMDGRAELFLSKLKRQIEKDINFEEPKEEQTSKGKSLTDKIAFRILQKNIP